MLGVQAWDLDDPLAVNRLGTLARFTALLADYESVRRRARPDADDPGEQVGGQDRGDWYYRNLAIHIVNYAQGAYEDFDGEDDFDLDAVDLTTVHGAKGLEWPVVFVPSLTDGGSRRAGPGTAQDWLVPRDRFDAARYEGSDADERRLFYVAMTRARDWLSLSVTTESPSKRGASPSPYFSELAAPDVDAADVVSSRRSSRPAPADETIELTYSELASFLDCAMAYRLRNAPRVPAAARARARLRQGRPPRPADDRRDTRRRQGRVPTEPRSTSILDASFFLPSANKPAHRKLKEAGRRLVTDYASNHQDDLHRVWETERPFELHLDGVTVSGRADVILDHEGGVPTALAIVDYKTSTSGGRRARAAAPGLRRRRPPRGPRRARPPTSTT